MRVLIPFLLCAALIADGSRRQAGAGPARSAPTGADTARVRLGPVESGSDAFVAWPAGQGPVPAILVLHEWWGLNGQIRDVARRLAGQGYVAVVPDLYHGQVASDAERARALMQGLDQGDAMATLDEAVRWLHGQRRSAKGRIGIVGFCMGGGLAERYALRARGLSAVVMFYGQPETDPAKLAGLSAPLQGHFGAEDQSISLTQVEDLKSVLARVGKTAEIYTYAGAGHAFMHEGRETYRPDAARQAWARTLAFFQQHLKGR